MLVGTFFPIVGGAQRQAQRLAEALLMRGWELEVLTRRHTTDFPDGLPRREIFNQVQIFRIFSKGFDKLDALFFIFGGLIHLALQGTQGIFHAHDEGATSLLAISAARLLGGRSVIKLRTGRAFYIEQYASPLKRYLFLLRLRGCNKIVVVNKEVKSYLGSIKIPEEKTAYIPNGIDIKNFRPASPRERSAAIKRLYFEQRRTCLFVGRLDRLKGCETLIDAWATLSASVRAGCRLVIVGDGPFRAQVEKKIDDHGLQDSVRLEGMQEDVLQYYWAADLLVLPSEEEGLSNVLLEAMACGLPVLATNVGGACDFITHGSNGWLFEGRDLYKAGHFSRIFEAALAVEADWRKIGQRARETIESNLDMSHIAEMYEQLYLSLFDER